jgi:Gram-negative bacterial TonB protein C-terminal
MTSVVLFAILFFFGFFGKCLSQDSLPPLHTLKERDIKRVITSFGNATITVTMKNGTVYFYEQEDWDNEDAYPSLCLQLKAAINSVTKTFTKCEHPPVFPGGQEAWDKYMREFCGKISDVIKSKGAVEMRVQFVVHVKGQISDINVLYKSNGSDLERYAVQAIRESGPWTSATQNGHKVAAYCMQTVKFTL